MVFEILLEVYFEFMLLIVPEEKATSKKYRTICFIMAMSGLLIVLGLFVGAVILIGNERESGLIPLFAAIVLSIVQIVAGIVLYTKKSKKSKKNINPNTLFCDVFGFLYNYIDFQTNNLSNAHFCCIITAGT